MKKLISFITAAAVITAVAPVSAGAAETKSYSTAEEMLELLVSRDGSFSGIEAVDGTKYRTDAKLGAGYEGRCDYLIVYGFETEDEVYSFEAELSDHGYYPAGDPEVYSGKALSLAPADTIDTQGQFLSVLIFMKGQLPGFMTKMDLLEAARGYGFDVAPYIFDEIMPGDADGDGTVTAADASVTLSAYAGIMTGEELDLNETIFDYNSDGNIDAGDASEMLLTYAENMTRE